METRKWILQMFAEDGVSNSNNSSESNDGTGTAKSDEQNGASNGTDGSGEGNATPNAKYTDEDVNRIIDKKFAEWQKKQQKKQNEIDEAKKLANMTAEEKRAKEVEALQNELASLKAKANAAEMAESARAIFAQKNVNAPDAIVNMLINDSDAEATKEAVESYINVFQAEVQKAVKDALKGKEPSKGSGQSGVTKESIMKIANRAERQRLIRENPNLFGI